MRIFLFCLGGLAAIVLVVVLVFLVRRMLSERTPVVHGNALDNRLVHEAELHNLYVWGEKRAGKDLLFAHLIYLRNHKHYSNIVYNEQTEVRELCELGFGDNTFEDLINGTFNKVPCRFEPGCDFYISDAGIYLMSDEYKVLQEKYPSMPMFFALSSQVYGINVHCNTQGFDRVWKKLREQAGRFVHVVQTDFKAGTFNTKIEVYDKFSNAEAQKDPLFCGTVKIALNELQYDTHYFRKVVLEDLPSFLSERVLHHIGRLNHIEGGKYA